MKLNNSCVEGCLKAGHICFLRFIPAEFGTDPDRIHVLDLQYGVHNKKAEVRPLIEREQIPYTYICCNYFADYFLPSLVQVQPNLQAPPRDKVVNFGDGNTKGTFTTLTTYLLHPFFV